MKRFDFRILIGLLLILGSVLMILDKAGIIYGVSDYFWAGVMAIGAALFLVWFFRDRSKWWAAIPGFALAGLSASSLLPDRLGWDGFAFLGGIGIGFFAVYFARRDMWWALIPGGVLLTLGVSAALTNAFNIGETGGVFMVGLGITFLIVALHAKMNWAFIPAAALLVIGFFLGMPFTGALSYVWIGVLLLGGAALIFGSLRK